MTALSTRSWFEQVKERTTIREVVERLGLGGPKGRFSCPACSANRSSTKDKRPPCGSKGDHGWRCHACKEGGDTIHFVSFAELGCRTPGTKTDRDQLRNWFASYGYCEPAKGSVFDRSRFEDIAKRREQRAKTRAEQASKKEAKAKNNRARFIREVRKVWKSCYLLLDDSPESKQAREYLAFRGFSPEQIANLEDSNAARVLSSFTPCKSWMSFRGKSWYGLGAYLVLPCFDLAGNLVSLKARPVDLGAPKPKPGEREVKSLSPKARDGVKPVSNCVFSNDVGLLTLRRNNSELDAEHFQDWLPSNCDVCINEGDIDYLSRVSLYRDSHTNTPIIYGIWAGAWSQSFGDLIPDNSTVSVRTHLDKAGDKYFAAIAKTLAPRHQSIELRKLVGNE